MKNWTKGTITAAFLLAGSVAMAQDASNPPSSTTSPSSTPSSTMSSDSAMKSDTNTMASKKQQMKDCMAKMEAKNDGSTKTQMKKACKDEMKGADSMAHDSMNQK